MHVLFAYLINLDISTKSTVAKNFYQTSCHRHFKINGHELKKLVEFESVHIFINWNIAQHYKIKTTFELSIISQF